MTYQMSVEFFVPSFDAFVLNSSKLNNADDMLGPAQFNKGKWIAVTCDTGDIKIEQSYQQFHPLGIYETGVAEITMKGINWSPSVNQNIMPGVKVRISAVQEAVSGQFSNQFTNQFLTTGWPRTQFDLFYGYILDIDETWVTGRTYPDSMVVTAVDEYHKIVKLEGDKPSTVIGFNTLPSRLRALGVNAPDTTGLVTTSVDWVNSQQQFERSVYSVVGSTYVKDDKLIIDDNSVWTDKPATMKITDVHSGPHLCYTDFDKRQRLTNVMNHIEQTNTITVMNSSNELEEKSTTVIFRDDASIAYYGNSGHTVTTNLSLAQWPGNSYITAGRYPEVRTRTVDVELRPDNVNLLPNIQDSVEFTNRGTTEKRRVAGRTLHFTPKRWEGTIKFFDFILNEPPKPQEPGFGPFLRRELINA